LDEFSVALADFVGCIVFRIHKDSNKLPFKKIIKIIIVQYYLQTRKKRWVKTEQTSYTGEMNILFARRI